MREFGLARDASVVELLRPIVPFLRAPDITEICINQPGLVFVEQNSTWARHPNPDLTLERCISLAIAIAAYAEQDISAERPLLSATLPSGERVQLVMPPACERNTVSISIRLPSSRIRDLKELEQEGMFSETVWNSGNSTTSQWHGVASAQDKHLVSLLKERSYCQFFEDAVGFHRNIAIVGDTGSGKTSFMKTICQSIPVSERIITIEDVRELFFPRHENCVHLTYSKGAQGVSRIMPSDLIASAMRMKPDRVILAELRGSEAFDFLKLLTSGHAGSITSFHASSCSLAVERFMLMAKEHPEASVHTDEAMSRLLRLTVDVIVHICRIGNLRRISEIHFAPK